MTPVEEPADLTPLQRKYLCNLQEFIRRPPTMAGLVAKSTPAYIVLFSIFGIMVWGAAWLEVWEAVWLAVGMVMGAVLRDMRMFRNGVLLWPVSAAVIDRKKLAMLTEQPPDDPEHW